MTRTGFSHDRFIVLTLLASLVLPSANLLAQNRLFVTPSEEERILNAEQQRKYRSFEQQSTTTRIDLIRIGDLLPALRRRSLPINLPGQLVELSAEPSHVKYYSPDDYIWNGRLLSGNGRIALVNNQGKFTGTIQLGGQWYKIEPLGAGMHALITVDMTRLPSGDATPPGGRGAGNISSPTNAHKTSGSNKNIEVLVLYTDAADDAVGDIAGTAALAVNDASVAYSNSAITSSQLSVDHIGTSRIDFEEGKNIDKDVNKLAANTEANNKRDSFWGDVVILFTDGDYFSGSVYGIAKEIEAHEDSAYAIVEADKATVNFALAHELGHLQGGRHQQCSVYDIPTCDDTAGSAHGYGWAVGGGNYRWTILHQLGRSGNPIQYFSNPSVSYHGKATGRTNNNVAQKLRDTASRMADFRTGDRLSAVILGTTNAACSGDALSFSASVSGGTGSYSYRWDTSNNGISYSYAGSGSSYTTNMPPSLDLHVKLTVTSGEQKKIDFEYVENIDGSPNCDSNKAEPVETILAEQDQLPEAFVLNEGYPNPFNPSTVIAYGVPEGGNVGLVVYDVWGREVARLVDGYRDAGHHSVVFDASHLSSGVYLYRLQADSFVASKQIILLK